MHKIPPVNFKIIANSLHGKREKLFFIWLNSYPKPTESIIMVLASAKVREEKELFNTPYKTVGM